MGGEDKQPANLALDEEKDCELVVKPRFDNALPSSSSSVALHVGLGSIRAAEIEQPPRFSNPTPGEALALQNPFLNANLANFNPSTIGYMMNYMQNQYQSLCQLNSYNWGNVDLGARGEDPAVSSAREDLLKSHLGEKKLKLSSKRKKANPRKPSENKKDGGNEKAILNHEGSQSTLPRKVEESKSAWKEVAAEFSPVEGGQNGTSFSVSKIPFRAVLKSSADCEESSHRNNGNDSLQALGDGIMLREWFSFEPHKVSKGERLILFKQIVEFVDRAQSSGIVLLELRPSYFIVYPSGTGVKYIGPSRLVQDIGRKRVLDQELGNNCDSGVKMQKIGDSSQVLVQRPQLTKSLADESTSTNNSDKRNVRYEHGAQSSSCYGGTFNRLQKRSNNVILESERMWYASPEELSVSGSSSSNTYSLGVLLFELVSWFESLEARSAAMLDLRHRILPPRFLSENPVETGFCLWLLHPDPSSRPTTREILQSEFICGLTELCPRSELSPSFVNKDDTESDLLLHFLHSLKEEKEKRASRLVQDIKCLEADKKEVRRRQISRGGLRNFEDQTNSNGCFGPTSMAEMVDARLMKNIDQLENVYGSAKSHSQRTKSDAGERKDKDLLKNREISRRIHDENEKHRIRGRPPNDLEYFFEGLCKFSRYSKFEVHGTLRNSDLLNSSNLICSLSFDRDEEFIATAGVSKKIKVFEFAKLLDDYVDVHYPVAEMVNKSKLSCISWNSYIRNYLASSDYDGVLQMWDASTGQGLARYEEHEKRAWSVDFSQLNPKELASGGDDCCVKLWNINEESSLSTIKNQANVCCVQYSAHSSHLLAVGSADFNIYCYDIRHTRIPWCTLAGHGKAVSYVKFLDSETLVSASIDNTLKLWDLKKTSLEGLSAGACTMTFRGHTNEKNFIGLSVLDGYISCGSETNEVYTYYRSLPMPITTHKFDSSDPGREVGEESGQFVSSVCWRKRSNMVVAANSSGNMKILKMV